MGSFLVTKKKSGIWHFQKLYAQVANLDNHSIGGRSRNAERIGKDQVKAAKFAALILAGMDLFKAYKMVEPRHLTTKYQLIGKVIKYMNSKVVRHQIETQLQSLSDDIRREVPGEYIGRQIRELLDNSEKGTKQHQENLDWVLKTLQLLPAESKKNGRQIEDAEVIEDEDTPPPIIRRPGDRTIQ